MIGKSGWDQIGDYIISIAVLAQPSLVLLQYLLSSVVGLELEQTTIYRVVLTIALLIPAIIVAFYRKPSTFILTFVFTALVLLYTVFLFPENRAILSEQAFRFLVPVVIPSFACFLAVYDFKTIKTSLQILGWIGTIGAIIYLFFFLMGRFSIDKYSLSFSYACLCPMLVLFSQKRTIPIFISLIIFFEVVAFGSRGAAVIFMAYIALNIFRQKGKMRLLLIVGGFLIYVVFPYFVQYLEHIGLYSRTVALMMNGGLAESEGREFIYHEVIKAIGNNPISGLGLYGDRVTIGAYSHNIVLEILLDFGVIIGSIIILAFINIIVKALSISKGEVHEVAMILFFCGVLPNMVSGSYLTEPNFALFMGFCVWIINHKNEIHSYTNVC